MKQADHHRVAIRFPDLNSARFLRHALTAGAPTALEEFNCFAVNVTGPGIVDSGKLSCPGETVAVGEVAGLASTSGGSVEVMVPAGSQRVFQVLGFKTSGGCPSVDALASIEASTRFRDVGKGYELGRATEDIFRDTTVTIKIGFNSASASPLFVDCVGRSGTQRFALTGASIGPAYTEAAPTNCHSNASRPCLQGRFTASTVSVVGGITAPASGAYDPRLQFRPGTGSE